MASNPTMKIRGGGNLGSSMSKNRMDQLLRCQTADAYGCIMVSIQMKSTEYKAVTREASRGKMLPWNFLKPKFSSWSLISVSIGRCFYVISIR